MEEFYNENQDYKDDFIYSYGNAKQGNTSRIQRMISSVIHLYYNFLFVSSH